jgi:hypothetical protein
VAIAATQAAVWHFTNGLRLDNRPLNVPVSVTSAPDAITFEFLGDPQLGSYTVELTAEAAVSMVLQKSVDGVRWRDVAASGLNVSGRGRFRRTLGMGATTSDTRPGRGHRGYRFYRLQVIAGSAVDIQDVTFTLHGCGTYRNAERVVALHDYLVAGADTARRLTVQPRLIADHAVVDADGVVGPFRFQATDAAVLTISAGAIVDAAGAPIEGPVTPGTELFVRLPHPAGTVTITASVPAAPNGFGEQVITGVAYDDTDSRLTPVALAVPAPTVIDFDITF